MEPLVDKGDSQEEDEVRLRMRELSSRISL